jgi:hypothetical protein
MIWKTGTIGQDRDGLIVQIGIGGILKVSDALMNTAINVIDQPASNLLVLPNLSQRGGSDHRNLRSEL